MAPTIYRPYVYVSKCMAENTLPTYRILIFVGYKVTDQDSIFMPSKAHKLLKDFVDKHGLCVTFSPTEYVYTGGDEPGAIIGLINYPRFPKEIKELDNLALELAKQLKKALKQKRLSIMYPDRTITLGEL